MSRIAPLLILGILLGAGPRPVWGGPQVITLEGIREVQGLRRVDVTNDGIIDLLLLEGRTVRVWPGRREGLPDVRARLELELPKGVSFVDALSAQVPSVLAVGTGPATTISLDAAKPATKPAGAGGSLTWRDGERASFAELTRPGGYLLPRPDGWSFRSTIDASEIRLRITPYRDVRAPGPFLEDSCAITAALPEVFVGVVAEAGAAPKKACLWSIDGRGLVAQSAKSRVRYDLSFLGAGTQGGKVDQTLVDLDRDRRPDLLHRIHTVQEVHYGFFRTRPAPTGSATGPSHKPAASALFLSGFQLDPELIDLNGDRFPDFVVTSIQINSANTVGAMFSGRVTAETRAFLNRWGDGKGTYFVGEADATIKSHIGVKVQFNYAGVIEVERSFTILADGDYDGDGRADLAIRTGPAKFLIRRGVATGVWAPEGREVAVPPMGRHPNVEGYAADLDGDGKDEMVLVYRKPAGGRDLVRIVKL